MSAVSLELWALSPTWRAGGCGLGLKLSAATSVCVDECLLTWVSLSLTQLASRAAGLASARSVSSPNTPQRTDLESAPDAVRWTKRGHWGPPAAVDFQVSFSHSFIMIFNCQMDQIILQKGCSYRCAVGKYSCAFAGTLRQAHDPKEREKKKQWMKPT